MGPDFLKTVPDGSPQPLTQAAYGIPGRVATQIPSLSTAFSLSRKDP